MKEEHRTPILISDIRATAAETLNFIDKKHAFEKTNLFHFIDVVSLLEIL